MKRRPNANTVLANTDVFTAETDSPAERRDLPPMIKRKKRAITPRDTVVVQCVQAG
jgi:hypothetical protein